jgi:sphingomyelin phosphodiesterase 2
LTEQAQIDVLGVTCDSRLNAFRPTNLETATDDPNAKRIDYIFTTEAMIEEAQVVLTERIPIHEVNYSDHFGVSVTLQLPEDNRKVTGYLAPETFNGIREIALQYSIREEKHHILRICHFYLSLVVCTSMLTGVWFVEQKGSVFVMMFFSTMCSWCGVLDGVIGYVWGKSELRALREFTSEIDLARQVYAHERIPLR